MSRSTEVKSKLSAALDTCLELTKNTLVTCLKGDNKTIDAKSTNAMLAAINAIKNIDTELDTAIKSVGLVEDPSALPGAVRAATRDILIAELLDNNKLTLTGDGK